MESIKRISLWKDEGRFRVDFDPHPHPHPSGSSGIANNQLSNPYGLSMDFSTKTLFIADGNNHRIMRYRNGSTMGTVVVRRNILRINSTFLSNPIGVHFNSMTGSIIFANSGSHNVLRWMLAANNWNILAGSHDGSSDNSPTLLSSPRGVTLDSMGNLYVVDGQNHRIQFFQSAKPKEELLLESLPSVATMLCTYSRRLQCVWTRS
jgi:sugar lactone lactonase YvrE